MPIIFVIHLVASIFMTGLIWMVQIVHYALFRNIDKNEFSEYQKRHSRLIGFIVGPVMTVELITAMLIAGGSLLSGTNHTLFLIACGLLIMIWISTIVIQIPQHKKLSGAHDAVIVEKLVNYNWIRTLFWTARAFILGYIVTNLI